MEFNPNKTPVQVIKERVFAETFLETFIIVYKIQNSIEIHGKNLMI